MAAAFVDYYELLEIQPDASSGEIKAAYRACMLRDHVDQNPDSADAHERMIVLSRAKQVLLDDHQRRLYDRERTTYLAAARFGVAPPRWTGGAAPDERHRVEVDLRDVSIGRLLFGVGVAVVATGVGLGIAALAGRAQRRRRS